jgi:hypothetical protein
MEGQAHHPVVEARNQPKPKRQRGANKKSANKKPVIPSVLCFNPETMEHSISVRSSGPIERSKSVALQLTAPGEDEECTIAMEPIAQYRLPFLPDTAAACVWEDRPALTKAILPCGHGFSAMALLYHFAKNSMTCPCCRAGHDGVKMGLQSVPTHLRDKFARHLETVQADEVREQIASDAIAATRALEQEVRMGVSLPMTRVVLLLFAYDAPVDDGRSASEEPRLVLELPLTSSLTLGSLAFASYGYFLHQLNLNLRLLPIRALAFEVSVGLQNFLHGSIPLFRTVRFPAEGAGRRLVFAAGTERLTESMAIEVETTVGHDGCQLFTRLCWSVPVDTFSNLLVGVARANEGEIAEV